MEELRHRKVVRIHIEPLDRKVAYKGISNSRYGECDYKDLTPHNSDIGRRE